MESFPCGGFTQADTQGDWLSPSVSGQFKPAYYPNVGIQFLHIIPFKQGTLALSVADSSPKNLVGVPFPGTKWINALPPSGLPPRYQVIAGK
ncbi:MAG: hypothetical protein WDM76_10355 [Limisphaerales bacterium]